jgi:DNA-binding NtrC family response regulator
LSFPGNVRELKSMVFDAVARHTEGELTAQSFGGSTGRMSAVPSNGSGEHSIDALFGHFPTSHEVDEYLIDEAMRRSAGNINSAAAMLGITRQTIANRRKKQGRAPVNSGNADAIPMNNLFEISS